MAACAFLLWNADAIENFAASLRLFEEVRAPTLFELRQQVAQMPRNVREECQIAIPTAFPPSIADCISELWVAVARARSAHEAARGRDRDAGQAIAIDSDEDLPPHAIAAPVIVIDLT